MSRAGAVAPRMISCPREGCDKRHIIAAPCLAPFVCRCGARINPWTGAEVAA